ITGGKYTTYRAMCEEAADMIAPKLSGVHVTAEHQLNHVVVPELKEYGVYAPAVLECTPQSAEGLSMIEAAKVIYAIRHEMALHPRDVLEVSTQWSLEGRTDLIPAVEQYFR